MADETHPCDYAFPIAPGDVPYWQPGMSLRDWFAGQALAGIMASGAMNQSGPEAAGPLGRSCYAAADAMLAAREGGAS